MQNFAMKHIVMIGLIAGAVGIGGCELGDGRTVTPADPAGTQTGQLQRDRVTQFGEGERIERGSIAPLDPAGTQTGQAERDPVRSVAPGGGSPPFADQFTNPSGTQSGP